MALNVLKDEHKNLIFPSTKLLDIMLIILDLSNCQGNLNNDIGHNVTKNCAGSWNTCQMHLESSLFHGNIKSQDSGEYASQNQIANLNTILEFYCDNGWRLHPGITSNSSTGPSAGES